MAKVVITCDRCKTAAEGLLTPAMTAGFYSVYQETDWHGPGAWTKYGREGEDYICDHCMWSDPEYQKDYPSDAVAKAHDSHDPPTISWQHGS